MAYPQTSVPETQASVFYAYTITINNEEIGTLEKFSSKSTRNVERIREVLFSRGPETKEIVWGGTDTSVDIEKVELYQKSLLELVGREIHTLEDFTFPVNIVEIMQLPAGLGGGTRVLTFVDAVCSNWGKSQSTGQARVVESMTFEVRTVRGFR
jgi:hypothetical protein